MRLELSHIRQPETEFHKVLPPADVQGENEDYRVTAPVALRMVIHKDRDRFRLVGNVKTELELACSRCLEPFTMPIDREFDLRYLPATHAAAPSARRGGAGGAGETPGEHAVDEQEVEDDDVAVTFYRDEQIDLSELLREQFYLALPMKPLCRDDCQGICPQCGTNRNTASCSCTPQWEDPRLAGLKTLLGPTMQSPHRGGPKKRKDDDA